MNNEKYDKTRLNNLLLKYRNDIISIHYKHVPKYQIHNTVTLIDNAIINIQIGLNKKE